MDALNKYLQASNRNKKEETLEDGLTLPRIPERPSQSIPKTALKPRLKQSVNRKRQFVSETTLSP